MKKIAGMLFLSLLSPVSMAGHMPLDKVMFQISAKQWVSTQSALLTVNVNATLNNADLVKARSDIMDHLNKIAIGEWHVTRFDRSQDSSGLEKLYVEAQTRVPQSSLTSIYQNAKGVSRPGATYSINGIEFKPDLQEIQQVKAQLREKLYQQVNDEMSRLNKTYSSQHYTVNQLLVIDGDMPQQTDLQSKRMNVEMLAAAAPMAAPVAVSNELVMSALVVAASNRQRNESDVPNKQ